MTNFAVFFQILIISVLLQILLFIPAFLAKTDKLTDFSYSLGFVLISAYAFLSGGKNFYQLVLFILIVIWALRLGGYLVLRIAKEGTDKRFDQIRIDFWKFVKFWVFQGVVIPIILIPSFYYFKSEPEFNFISVTGLAVWLGGILVEGISDLQKFAFKNDPKNKNKWIDTGLWKFSRHPNYLGEIMCWTGIYIFSFSSLTLVQKFFGLISPLTIITLLIFVSGIPILEKNADMKWGKNDHYQKYKKDTPVLIPFIY